MSSLASAFPETTAALRRVIFDWRSMASIKLLMLAMRVAPEREHLSMTIAAHGHLRRIVAMDQIRKASAPDGTGPTKGEDA